LQFYSEAIVEFLTIAQFYSVNSMLWINLAIKRTIQWFEAQLNIFRLKLALLRSIQQF